MSESKLSINTIVAIGIGAAVFIILSRFGSIPTFIPNTNVETAYAFLAFNLLSAPCFAAIGAMHREFGNGKWTLIKGFNSLWFTLDKLDYCFRNSWISNRII